MTLSRSNSLLITFLFLAVAIACYALGLILPGTLFLVAGGPRQK
jgi:hypothetical protein